MIWKVANSLESMPVQLADMDFDDQTPLRLAIDEETAKITVRLCDLVRSTKSYKLLSSILPTERLELYFEKYIRDNVYPTIRALYISEWYQSKHNVADRHTILWCDHKGLGPLMTDLWPSNRTTLSLSKWYHASKITRSIKTFIKHLIGIKITRSASIQHTNKGPRIAIHAIEGVDKDKRSDMFWYDQHLTNSSDALIVFTDKMSAYLGELTPESVLKEFDEKGLPWVCLRKNIVERKNALIWRPPFRKGPLYKVFLIRKNKPTSQLETFAERVAKSVLKEVDYWSAFYKEFNIKIYSSAEGGNLHNISQCIALDLTGGIRAGWQRSEVRLVQSGEIGARPNHVFFTWNKWGSRDAQLNRNRINSIVVSGFPYSTNIELTPELARVKETLMQAKVKLTIAVLDNYFWWGGLYSKNMVSQFYEQFLRYVTSDPEVAVITKSKKPSILESLPNLKSLLRDAEDTGRWINLADVTTRLPSDASKISDISVGLGISSAVSEAVSQGNRGIHLDLNRMYFHPLYKWGRNQVIFDNLPRLLERLEIFKLEKHVDDTLGSFGRQIKDVDPFHDGHGDRRISQYMQWLIESIKQGHTNIQAIDIANNHYSDKWGEDHITFQVETHSKNVSAGSGTRT